MAHPNNVVRLSDFRAANQQELIDDISAEAFMMLRDAAMTSNISVKDVLLEHLGDIVRVFNSVEGADETRAILEQIERQILG
ncbi:hypothetical protein [Litorivivens sp.]|uniref:hypothetical protein n=1 Tax=Litorivivens sp. TaxID=2020868 RepID=UPI00356536B9